MGLLSELGRRYRKKRASAPFDDLFEAWRATYPPFAEYKNVEALIKFFRDDDDPEDYEPKNAVAIILAGLAREGDETAGLVLFELYLPGLYDIADEYGKHEVVESDDLDAEIVAGFWAAAEKLTPDTQIATGKLMWGAKDKAIELVTKAIDKLGVETLPEDFDLYWSMIADLRDTADPFGEVEAQGSVADVLRAAEEEDILTNFEAHLIALTRLEGLSLQQVADCLGVGKGRIKGRRHRAEGRLVRWLRDEEVPARRKISARV